MGDLHINVVCNEKKISVLKGETAFGLRDNEFPGADVVILRGFQILGDAVLCGGDSISMFQKGQMPEKHELEYLMMARHTPGVHEKLKDATVGIAGLGGLGSNIAVALCRLGVGKLILGDFDVVEPSNLNRQNYMIRHIGHRKVDATKELLEEINPFVKIEIHPVFLNRANVGEIFKEVDVFVEALDNPECKAELVTAMLTEYPDKPVVAASGMAGFGSGNNIKVGRSLTNLYVCGDNVTGAEPGNGLMAPRVMITAGQQANMVLRLLLGIKEI